MFKARKLKVEANHQLIALLLETDAKKLGLDLGDKIKVFCDKPTNNHCTSIICDVNIVDSKEASKKNSELRLKSGEIGFFGEAFEKLEVKEGSTINVAPAPKPRSVEYVRDKFKGKKLSEKQFLEIIQDITNNNYTDVETTYFVLACTAHALDDKEVIGLTKAMIAVGKVLNFKTKSHQIIVDKHCIGGIPGNRTTMVVIPIVAAAGLIIPKTSSRSITSPAGTADTMEVLANVELGLSDMYKIVKKTGGCIAWGGALALSPADDIIINVEHPLDIDSEGQMIASILSKKKSAGSTHVLMDIPVGENAKVKNKLDGLRLKKRFEKVGRAIDLNIKVILTDGSQPIGRGIGPLLEAEDVLKVLRNDKDAPKRLKEKSILMAGLILEMGGIAKKGEGQKRAKEILEFNLAYEKFNEIIKLQGKKKLEKHAKYSYEFKSNTRGKVISIDNKLISKLAFTAGAPEDKAAGLYIKKRIGDKVEEGEPLFELYSNSKLKLEYSKAYALETQPFKVK